MMRVELQSGRVLTCVEKSIGAGGTGEVFAAVDGEHVIKLYRKPSGSLTVALQRIVAEYAVVAQGEWAPLFRWPVDIVNKPRLGVCVPRLPSEFCELSWIVLPRALATRPTSWRSWELRLRIGWSLAMAVARLHSSGLAHSDLSHRNIWVNPLDGRMTLIDMDGLVVPGVVHPQVLGTPGYIAPELLANSERQSSAQTDLHALAVLLYQLLLYRHPLRGPKVFSADPVEDERLALGVGGVFIDHPRDRSNRPVPWQDGGAFWPTKILGAPFVELFERAFVEGLREPSVRPTAAEWVGALVRLADRIVRCGARDCPERWFPLAEGIDPRCPWCGRRLPWPADPVLHMYQSRGNASYVPKTHWWMVGTPGRKLFMWHAIKGARVSPFGFLHDPIAEVESANGVWSLRNRALPELRVVRNGQPGRGIGIGESVALDERLVLLLDRAPTSRALVVSRFRGRACG